MPKMKAHSGARKRLKKLKSGKIKFAKAGKRHLLTKKTANKKRKMRKGGYICKADLAKAARLLPNT